MSRSRPIRPSCSATSCAGPSAPPRPASPAPVLSRAVASSCASRLTFFAGKRNFRKTKKGLSTTHPALRAAPRATQRRLPCGSPAALAPGSAHTYLLRCLLCLAALPRLVLLASLAVLPVAAPVLALLPLSWLSPPLSPRHLHPRHLYPSCQRTACLPLPTLPSPPEC